MGVKISALPHNELPYSGSEQFPLVQINNLVGETRAGTLSSLVNYLSGDFAFYNRANEFTQSQTVSGDLTVTGAISATVFNAISANFSVIDIKQYELSGFNVTGDVSVTGNLSATDDIKASGIVYDLSGNSTNWNNAYSSTASTSASWDSVYASTLATSANWDSVYASTLATSANWNNAYSSTASTSANWDSVYSSVASTSANWDSVYASTLATSANWDSVYSSVASTSGNWDSVYTSTLATSGNWNNVYSSVASTSGNWNNAYTATASTSGNWNNAYTATASTSGNWNNVYATVNTLSTSWEGGGTVSSSLTSLIIPTGSEGSGLIQLGLDIDGEAADDRLGESVSMNATGDRVAIGATYNDGNGGSSGHVRVYSWNGTAWTQLGLDINGEATGDLSGYSISINAAGDRVAIGAMHNDGNGTSSGHVRIYSWNGTVWTQLGSDINGEAAGDLAYVVSMNAAGDRVAIGAPFNNGSATDSGHVRVYSWDGAAWTQLGLDIDGEAAGNNSGTSVSMNAAGDRVAIGAPANNGGAVGSGHVRIYSWNGTAWTQLGSDIDGIADDEGFGASVSMNAAGDRVAIGAPFNPTNPDPGHVRVYNWSGTSWVKLGSDIVGENIDDRFGEGISMNAAGDRVAIGAPANNSSIGHVRIYSWNGTAWTQLFADIDGEAAGDNSGTSVSMNAAGDRVAIGAPFNNGINGSSSGHVRIYTDQEEVQSYEYTFPTVSGIVPIVPVYADLTAANAALDSGDFYWDTSLNKLRVATS